MIDKFGSLYVAFEQVASHPQALEEEELVGAWTVPFTDVAKENVMPSTVQIDGYLEMTCPLPDGVDHIRDALLAGTAIATEQIKIQYIGAPRYRIVVNSADYKTAEEEMKNITTHIIENMESCGGTASFRRESK